MAHSTDYFAVDIPTDKSPEEYHWTQRRADLLQEVLETGTPSAVSRTEMGNRYDVDHSQISRDMDAIAECVEEHLGDTAKLQTKAAFERVLRELYDADDWRATKAAWDVVADWNSWLGDLGEQDREPERSEVEVSGPGAEAAYRVVHDSEDVDEDDAGAGFTSTPVGDDS
jgi:hypothetical protein